MNKLYIAVGIMFILSGCSSWQPNQLKEANWYKLGFNEGYNGYTRNWRTNYHMIIGGTPEHYNDEAYDKGFMDGLTAKCKQTHCSNNTLAER